jgi:hypothetical protein
MRVKQIIHYAASRIWQELQLLEDVNILDIWFRQQTAKSARVAYAK